ncbi:hypothetical protein [Rhodococcus sp. IEGM 1408]|uniref:hypothetical protein n=1 Tax=Rhodococcus sp. IEGM 1408 TaxID=3082220 RepID=UPI00295435C1|nr:hypothetical protein [Rhodococcus sp. IEGM 1408]MDV8000150.1 hypothetical protein [Rhodococcus sp. IEGM 1408]
MNTTSTSRRLARRSTAKVAATLAVSAVAVAAAISAPATAHAQGSANAQGSSMGSADAIPQVFPAPNRLVATGGSPTGACVGAVSTTLNGNGYPGTASVSWAFAVVGVGPCNLTATLSWRNLDNNTSGQKVAQIPQPRISLGVPDPIAHPYDAIISTGSGRVEYRLTTTGGAVAGPIVVDTVAYSG